MTHQHRGRRVAALTAVLAMLATLLSLVAAAAPASAATVVSNPGTWTFTNQSGFQNFAGNAGAAQTPVQPVECNDGINNDVAVDSTVATPVPPQDTLIDYPADPECHSINDNSESFQGTGNPIVPVDQVKAVSSFKANVAADGTMSSFVLSFPTQYLYSSKGCVRINQALNSTGNSGTVNPLTGAATVNLSLNVTIVVNLGCGSSGVSCAMNPVNVSLSTSVTNPAGPPAVTPAPYDPSTGIATLADNTFALPATTGFGCAALNTAFHLPAASGQNALQFTTKAFPATNTAPVTNAGANQTVNQGSTVTLHGGGTDADQVPCGTGTPCPTPGPNWFKWSQTGGTAVTLSDPFAAQPTFTAPAASSTPLTFSLVTGDGGAVGYNGAAASTQVLVNAPPIAVAGGSGNQFGDVFAITGNIVTLSGANSSDPDNGPSPLTYAWTQTGGPAVSVSGANTVSPSFTAPSGPTTLTFSLVVNDGLANSAPSSVTVRVSGAVSSTVTNDFTGDGKADPVLFNPTNGYWSIKGFGTILYGRAGDIAVPGDYNGDHIADLSVFVPADSATTARARSWFTWGQATVVWPNAQAGDIPVPADYNGDGKIDQALYRPSTHTWFFSPADSVGVSFGVTNAVPVPADYNGDGTADIAYYDPATGNWVIGSGTSTASPTTKNLGGAGYIPVPGNYDGVAGADLAVYRKSDGKWFLVNLTTVAGSGQVGDVPATADYDGDGRQDIARYRNGNWLINLNHNAVYADTSISWYAGPNYKAVAQPYAITSLI